MKTKFLLSLIILATILSSASCSWTMMIDDIGFGYKVRHSGEFSFPKLSEDYAGEGMCIWITDGVEEEIGDCYMNFFSNQNGITLQNINQEYLPEEVKKNEDEALIQWRHVINIENIDDFTFQVRIKIGDKLHTLLIEPWELNFDLFSNFRLVAMTIKSYKDFKLKQQAKIILSKLAEYGVQLENNIYGSNEGTEEWLRESTTLANKISAITKEVSQKHAEAFNQKIKIGILNKVLNGLFQVKSKAHQKWEQCMADLKALKEKQDQFKDNDNSEDRSTNDFIKRTTIGCRMREYMEDIMVMLPSQFSPLNEIWALVLFPDERLEEAMHNLSRYLPAS